MKAIPRVFFCLCLLVAVPELAAQQRQDCCWSGSRTTPNCWASWPQSSLKMGRYDSPPSAPGVELRDAGALETAAHALRGSAANFEATQAVEAALKLELMGRDDDRVLTHLLSSHLRVKGAETVVAHDAMQAFMIAMKAPPDVIVLDVQMPGGTGMEALKKLKRSARTSLIPVVVLTGSVEPEAATSFKALGAIEFLRKPIDPEELYRVLCVILAPQELAG